MKTFFKVLCLPLMLSLSPLAAQEWSPEQKDVLQVVNNYTKASMRGNMDEIMSYFHADFIAWDYSMPGPLDLDSTQKVFEFMNQNFKQVSFKAQPVSIVFNGDVAIAHLNFEETMRDSEAIDHFLSGPWTATLVKKGSTWIFLCWTWVQS